MSHKTELKTELRSKEYIKKALDNLGFLYQEAAAGQQLTTKGRFSVHEKVDILITGNGNQNYDGAIGFQETADGTYKAIGDFYSLRTKDGRSVTADMLKCEVTAHAKECEVNDRLSALMFTMDESSRKETDKEITFTLNKWIN